METTSMGEQGASPARRLRRFFSVVGLSILVIILVAVAGLFVYEPSPTEGFGFSSAGKTIQLSDGRTLAYLETGDPEGRPVFHFHGGPGSRLELDDLELLYEARCAVLGEISEQAVDAYGELSYLVRGLRAARDPSGGSWQ
jgi:hypothetical protein